MRILDCHTFDSTLSTLAATIGVDPAALAARLRSFSGDDWPDHPPDYLWQKIVGEPKSFDGVYWFHLTRTLSPESFRASGILPLNQVIEPLWAMIFGLIGERQSPQEKLVFRERLQVSEDDSEEDSHSAWLFGVKASESVHWGPFGVLVRETAFKPREMGNHDYLQAPEIIEDICNCHSQWYGGNLLADFYRQSKPCIVKFLGDNNRPDVLRAALMYLWATIHGEPLGLNCSTCFDGRGMQVEPARIVGVEIVAESPSA
jgi:hypothetical protein